MANAKSSDNLILRMEKAYKTFAPKRYLRKLDQLIKETVLREKEQDDKTKNNS